MTAKTPAELLIEAERLVVAVQGGAVSPEDRAGTVEALAVDLAAAGSEAADIERRLSKLEAQVWTLSEAMVRIANATASIVPAGAAAKDNSHEP
jgi:hypothetical protein